MILHTSSRTCSGKKTSSCSRGRGLPRIYWHAMWGRRICRSGEGQIDGHDDGHDACYTSNTAGEATADVMSQILVDRKKKNKKTSFVDFLRWKTAALFLSRAAQCPAMDELQTGQQTQLPVS